MATTPRTAACLVVFLVLSACGGGGGGGSTPPPPTPTATLSASPASIVSGNTTSLTWSSTNATACTASGGWSGNKATSGTEASAALNANTTFSLTCTGTGGSASANAAVTVTPPPAPTVALTAMPPNVFIGSSTNLSWLTTNATSCTASGGWSGTKPTNGSEVTAPLGVTTTFTLSCTGPNGTGSASVTVTASQPLPLIQLTATPPTIATGGSATLAWTTQNATSCTAGGGWSGARPLSGSESTGPLNATTTYSLSCSGPGGGTATSATVTVVNNAAPTANAGEDRSVFAGAAVTLSGAASSDPDGVIATYTWTQTAGPAVALSGGGSDRSFTAPNVAVSTVLTFQLVVVDALVASSAPDTVNITVQPLAAGQVSVSGRITFARIPVTSGGWNYSGTTQQPARGITVELLNAANSTVLTSGSTDGSGGYSLSAPANTTVLLRARAEMIKTGAAPNWNIRVQSDVATSNTQYTVQGASFSSGSGIAQNLAIQSGWGTNPSATATGPRDAAPFAILDTIYRGLLKLQTLNPTINLPNLIVDWAPDNVGSRTFFSVSLTNGPHIVLTGEINVDTDEYDTQVIAHEFGHFIEYVFGRSDSIGGPHSRSDRLDPRLAWGEGFGYWFAGFVNDDSLMVDSGGGNQVLASSFNIETNSVLNPGWFSEASVWAILWDLYDAANDDTAALGAAPIWAILTGALRDSDAMTTIFTFIRPLKAANPAAVAQINQVVGDQTIVAGTLDDFGSTETNNAGLTDILPIYRVVTVGGGPYNIPSTIPYGSVNKLGNRRLLRLDLAAPRSVRITATTALATQDPDIVVYRRGTEVGSGETGANEDFTVSLQAGTHIIEVYECNNAGCAGDNPVPQNTTVTVNLQ